MSTSKLAEPFLELNDHDFDPIYRMESLPQCDFECPLCCIVKEDMLECANCKAANCRDCATDFTNRNKHGNVAQGKFECSICHKVTIHTRPDKILFDIFLNLKFMCPGACG